jgi:hypothetical protein
MRLSRMLFAAWWPGVVVAFVIVFAGIWAGAMRGRSIYYQEMASQRAQEVAEAEAAAKKRESMSYEEIAIEHGEKVERLNSLLHSGGEFNGRMSFVLFTDDYYRDPERYRRQWQRERDWHAQMAEKYGHAALRPWEPVAPDPPKPEP